MDASPGTKIELLTTVATSTRRPFRPPRMVGPDAVGRYIEAQLALKKDTEKAKKQKPDSLFVDNMLASMRIAVRKAPEVPLGRYLARFTGFYPREYARTVWVVTGLYFTRLCALPGFRLFRGNAHFTALMALTLALKYLVDNCPHSVYFAHVGGVSFEEHRYLEGLVLRLLDFRLYFDEAALYRMNRVLESFDGRGLETREEATTTTTTAVATVAGGGGSGGVAREIVGGCGEKEKEKEKEDGKAVGKKMIEFFREKMCCMNSHDKQ